jgi:tripartite-type tricarboxylate transporter receptor subunit TctC
LRDQEEARKSICRTLVAVLGLGIATTDARAEAWPTKPLRVIVAAGAGSTIDIVPRLVFEPLSIRLGQSIVIENRGGAGGTIAAHSVSKADPDGYTILVHSNAHTIAPSLYPNLGYYPERDFTAVVPFGITPSVLVVPPARGWKSVGDLVAAAKGKPGTLNFSSVGVGSATHLSAERFRVSAKVEAVHVPFKGGAEAMTEVIAGRIDFFFGPIALVLSQVQEGKLTALAVNGLKRSAALPNVPTTLEAGFADSEYPFWLGMFLPAKTPRGVVDKLNRETLEALQEPKVRDKLAALGFEPMPMTPAEFGAHVEKDIAVNATLVKAAGIKPH